MKSYVTIKFSTDNAAFDYFDEEIARILRELADRVQYGAKYQCIDLRDINGNLVGEFNHLEGE